MSALGMEWIFRLAVEPRRLWKRYLVQDVAVLPLFVSMTVRRLLGRRLVRSRPLTELQ
jgi:N-acetylglucosaminyldiphosphoundecaprenol N-acetyl-beta-D-mannosaminyltransferase